MILVRKYERGDEPAREEIYRRYLASTDRINNWDLVDVSAPAIVGAHLLGRDRAPLFTLAKSSSLWERRIAIISSCFSSVTISSTTPCASPRSSSRMVTT